MEWCADCWSERRLDTQVRASGDHTCMMRDRHCLEVTDARKPGVKDRSIEYILDLSRYLGDDLVRPEHRKLKDTDKEN